MSDGWHFLTENLADTPKKDGFYELAYIREDGERRTAKAFFRTKTRKEHYTDKQGKTHTRVSGRGWHMSKSAKMKTVIAWRDYGFDF